MSLLASAKTKRFDYLFVLLLLLVVFLVWQALFEQAGPSRLEIDFLDVGQGQAIFIQTPHQRQILIDGGPDLTVLEELAEEMSFFDHRINLVISTHPDADHLTGLIGVLENYQVDAVLFNGLSESTLVAQRWQELIKEKNIPLIVAQAGQQIVLDEDLVLKILWPDQVSLGLFSQKSNNASVVAQLVYGENRFLFPADIEAKVEVRLLDLWPDQLQSALLQVAHHGSRSSSHPLFLKRVNPQIAIISVGADNPYGHPHQDVLDRLADLNIGVYRTDQHGHIEILADQDNIEVKPEYLRR